VDINAFIRKLQFKRSIKVKLSLYYMLLVIVPFIFLGLMAYQSEKAALRERIRGHLTSIADIQKGRLESWLMERSADAAYIARDTRNAKVLAFLEKAGRTSAYTRTPQYRELLESISLICSSHGDLEALILNDEGRVMVATKESDVGQPRDYEGYYKGAIKDKGKTYIQDIYNDSNLKKISMAFSRAVQDPGRPGKTIGVAVLIVGMDKSFYPIFESWPGMRQTGDTIIARRDDGYIVFLNRLRFRPDAPLNLMLPVKGDEALPAALATSGGEGITETTDYRGVLVLAAYRYIPETKWGFVVKEDYDDAFSPVHNLTHKVFVIMALTFVLVLVLIYFVSKRISDPVVSLSELSRRIAGGDFDVMLPIKSGDELGVLASSFNDMALALVKYKSQVDEKGAELEKANRELSTLAQSLEEKVGSRTSELEGLNRTLLSMMGDLDERTEALEKSREELRKFASEIEESRNRVRENLEIVERANVELRRIDRLKDHFLGMMSHELRTPLSLITGYSSNLLADKSDCYQPKVLEALEGIQKGAERLKIIISEMLDVSRIDAKGLRLVFSPADIGQIVEDVLGELGSFIKERKQEVSVGDHSHLPEVSLDKKRIHQVLVNIIGNAIKFTPDGGKIEIAFEKKNESGRVINYGKSGDGFVHLVVKDSGIGLDKDELERIFEKFYEVGEIDKHATSKFAFLGRGVGLGLPIARGIIEAHGGRLWAESAGYDPENYPGSSFHIMLPVNMETREKALAGVVAETTEPEAAAPPAVAPAAAGQRREKKFKVLVIEDDLDILGLTEKILKDNGYDVIAAENGREGIEKTRQQRPDLLLLDVYMEDISGYEVCEILKAEEATKDVLIAMFTAGAQRWEINRGFKSGADAYITKPFKTHELIAKVGELLSRKSPAAENKG